MTELVAEGVARAYRTPAGLVTALAGVSFAVRGGGSLAVVGPSGSGKSTLLGLLAGLDHPDAGRVLLDGEDLARLSEARLARLRGARIGVVFQGFRLLAGMTALENVAAPLVIAGAAGAEERARAWLDRVGLADRAGHLPAQLSGGEQQRVAVARALAPGPSLLLADEPTGSLDAAHAAAVADLLFALAREVGAALVLVTHDAELAARADRRLRLRGGRPVEGP